MMVEGTVYRKIKNTSLAMYNEGLERAREHDLSSAEQLLKGSVRFDKGNVQARNLLGLVHLEMGEPAAAVRQWILSKNMQQDGNRAVVFLGMLEKDHSKLEKWNQAVKHYNQALRHVRLGSLDLAILQLRKAQQLNPKFVRAHGLMALCLGKTGQLQQAKKELQKVLELDGGNLLASRWLREMEHAEENRPKNRPLQEVKEKVLDEKKHTRQIMVNQSVQQFVAVVLGVVIGISVMAFLVTPGALNDRDARIGSLTTQVEGLESKNIRLEAEVRTLETQLEEKRGELEALGETYGDQSSYASQLKTVATVFGHYLRGNNEETVDAALAVEDARIQDPLLLELLAEVRGKVYPPAAQTAYNQGYALYNSRRYEEAIPLLEKSRKIAVDQRYSDDALYYLARCHQLLGRTDMAVSLFEQLLVDYPDSNMRNYTNNFLSQLKN
ncbi:tetratricopeptide repeat protein [Anaerotalea alkaliphila]|uniref:Tetratricopeptide repeat protein n=1 Tax=Anaerotalea alkaliphila TaxID=2662126 RepID=A0A7X5HWZ4_9FIRM|nr:tetratricopeptide repeat protein [Anaerotalea alkaliphila]NDL68203.1 tetratricopeptide repeat protein [Anaerotalea alkaliphila]